MFFGTVGAAMTGLPSIALSQTFSDPDNVRWNTAREPAPGMIRALLAISHDVPTCLTVNFPNLEAADAGPLTPTRQSVGFVEGIDEVLPEIDPRGLPYHWLRFQRGARPNAPDSETAVVGSGRISVTPLHFEHTDERTFAALKAALIGGH